MGMEDVEIINICDGDVVITNMDINLGERRHKKYSQKIGISKVTEIDGRNPKRNIVEVDFCCKLGASTSKILCYAYELTKIGKP